MRGSRPRPQRSRLAPPGLYFRDPVLSPVSCRRRRIVPVPTPSVIDAPDGDEKFTLKVSLPSLLVCR